MDTATRRDIFTVLVCDPAPGADALRTALAIVDDWEDFARHIRIHGIQGIALPRLAELADAVPQDTLESLRETVRADSARNLLHRKTLLTILDGVDVPILLTKGIALSRFVYENASMRPMVDIDFYVKPGEVETFEENMASLGFTPEERRRRPREWWIEKFQHLEPYLSPDGRVRVEAHLRNAGAAMPYRMDVGRAWERSVEADCDGRAVRLMAPDDDLAALILHLYVHEIHLVKLLGLCDLDRVVRRRAGLDWDRLLESGDADGFRGLLYLPLALCRSLLGTPVPETFLAACRPANVSDADLAFVADYMFRHDVARERMPARLAEAEGIISKAGILLHTLFPGKSELAERYDIAPGESTLAARVTHPFRQAGRWGGFAGRLLAGSGRQNRLVELSRKVAGWAKGISSS